jgi:hypothetical protein
VKLVALRLGGVIIDELLHCGRCCLTNIEDHIKALLTEACLKSVSAG